MKKQNFFLIVALLFTCNTIFAQTQDGFQIYLKPWYPGTPPIGGGIIKDTSDAPDMEEAQELIQESFDTTESV